MIVFGSALVGPTSENLRRAFARRNPDVRFVDAFAPVAVRQFLAAVNGEEPAQRYATGFEKTEVGTDLLVRAPILAPCTVRAELYRALGSPPPMVQLLAESSATVGPFEIRVSTDRRAHAHVLMITMNDEEFWLHFLSRPGDA